MARKIKTTQNQPRRGGSSPGRKPRVRGHNKPKPRRGDRKVKSSRVSSNVRNVEDEIMVSMESNATGAADERYYRPSGAGEFFGSHTRGFRPSGAPSLQRK